MFEQIKSKGETANGIQGSAAHLWLLCGRPWGSRTSRRCAERYPPGHWKAGKLRSRDAVSVHLDALATHLRSSSTPRSPLGLRYLSMQRLSVSSAGWQLELLSATEGDGDYDLHRG